MEKKFVKVPFDKVTAKRIADYEIDGKIVTRDERNARIVCWDKKNIDYPIIALIDCQDDNTERIGKYTVNGQYAKGCNGRNDLLLYIPEYMTFKDGDIIYCEFAKSNGDYYKWVAILKGEVDESAGEPYYIEYVSLIIEASEDTGKLEYDDYSDNIDLIRKAVPSEVERLIVALKNDPKERAKKLLKKFFPEHSNDEEEGKEFELNRFDRVLVRDSEVDEWNIDFFGYYKDEQYYCTGGGRFLECLPYNDRTAHLVGTTDNYEEDEKL